MPALQDFKADLTVLDSATILEKYIILGDCAELSTQQHSALKQRIAGNFRISSENVVIVGSAKLGFSIAPGKRYRKFGESSDIDVAIVNANLFDAVWREAYNFQRSGAYWETHKEFEHYVFRGWVRPDKLPRSNIYPFTKTWETFFRSLSTGGQFGPYKVSGALYQSDFFFHSYQRTTIEQCKLEDENIGDQ